MRFALTGFLALFVLIGAACAESTASVSIGDSYAYATAAVVKNGAVFTNMTASNDDTLISVSGDIAEKIEIHDMGMEDGMMRMRKLDALPLPAGETVALDPTGKHIMLIGLKEQLKEGEDFSLTLHFENAGEKAITVSIVAPGQQPQGSH